MKKLAMLELLRGIRRLLLGTLKMGSHGMKLSNMAFNVA
jgi:hypothetical protein